MSSYCSKCGKELGEGTRFCPTCGFDTMGQGSGSNYSSNHNQNTGPQCNISQDQSMGGTLTLIFVLGVIWALIAGVTGLVSLIGGGALYYYDGAILMVVGLLFILSALFAFLCCMNIYKLENHQQASIFCLIGSILAIPALVGVIGVIFYFVMQKEKSRFKS